MPAIASPQKIKIPANLEFQHGNITVNGEGRKAIKISADTLEEIQEFAKALGRSGFEFYSRIEGEDLPRLFKSPRVHFHKDGKISLTITHENESLLAKLLRSAPKKASAAETKPVIQAAKPTIIDNTEADMDELAFRMLKEDNFDSSPVATRHAEPEVKERERPEPRKIEPTQKPPSRRGFFGWIKGLFTRESQEPEPVPETEKSNFPTRRQALVGVAAVVVGGSLAALVASRTTSSKQPNLLNATPEAKQLWDSIEKVINNDARQMDGPARELQNNLRIHARKIIQQSRFGNRTGQMYQFNEELIIRSLAMGMQTAVKIAIEPASGSSKTHGDLLNAFVARCGNIEKTKQALLVSGNEFYTAANLNWRNPQDGREPSDIAEKLASSLNNRLGLNRIPEFKDNAKFQRDGTFSQVITKEQVSRYEQIENQYIGRGR